MTESPSRLRRLVRFLYGDSPRMAFLVYSPTLLAMALDVVLRPMGLVQMGWGMKALYLGSALAGAGIWGPALWFASRLFLVEGRFRVPARVALAALFGGVFLPFAIFAYGGQVLYHHVFHAYISRDTVRMGIRLRSTVAEWLFAWIPGLVAATLLSVAATVLVAYLVRRAAAPLRKASPVVPLFSLAVAGYCYWTDFIETRALQAAPPDACFLHGGVYALRMALTHPGRAEQGVTLRFPDPLPPLEPAAHRPNVVVILSESLRADAMCSEKAVGCDAPFLDEAAPDRAALGDFTAQASGTFISCMMLWTGLPPDVDVRTAHRAPMLWELARAVGYRTAYIGSQHLLYQDLGTYLRRAGIDVLVSAADLGEAPDVFIGAPDEAATARTLDFVREVPAGTPYFALLHLSNTHWGYRVDPALQPFEPHSPKSAAGPKRLKNHYRNSVRLQERTVAAFLRDLRKTPAWDDTVVLFLADHGEQFREHHKLYHLNNLFDEEVRVPSFLVAGDRALDAGQRAAVESFAGTRTYSQDMQATIVDLFGLFEQRSKLPFAELVTGRSMVRPRPADEPAMPMSTTSGVWEAAEAIYGMRRGSLLVVGTEARRLQCYDSESDPGSQHPISLKRCGTLVEITRKRFPMIKGAKGKAP